MPQQSKRGVALDELDDVAITHCICAAAIQLTHSYSESDSGSDDKDI